MKLNLPPFVYVKAFWESLSFFLAGLAGVLVVFHVLDPIYAVGAGALLTWFLGFLKFLGIEPQIRMREAVKNAVAIKAKSRKSK